MKNATLNAYTDSGCTNLLEAPQVFQGTGSLANFRVNIFTGSHLGSVYVETQTSVSGVSFTSGVGSGFTGLTPSALIGNKIIHNGQARGFIVANDTTTVTISDLTYTASAATAILSAVAKKLLSTHYTVAIDGGTGYATITMLGTPLTTAQFLYALPAGNNSFALNFGGAAGAVVTKAGSLWLKREAGRIASSINLFYQDASITQAELTQNGITWASGVGAGFSGLVASALIGRAVVNNGLFIGLVTANTTTTVTIDDTGYNNAVAYTADIFTIGRARLAPDSGGSPGTYVPVLNPADISTDTPVRFWVDDTLVIPTDAINYPSQVLASKFIASVE